MKYAVTGSTGGLGSAAIGHLLNNNVVAADVVAIARSAEKAADLNAKGVDVRIADYQDAASLEAAFAGVDKVLLVSSSEVGKRFDQHKNVIDAAVKAGVKQLLYTSITNAQTSTNVLAPEHKATENYLMQAGIDYVVLRNNWYTENYLSDIQQAAQSGEFVSATGSAYVASALRTELAEAAAKAMISNGHSKKVYELAGPKWTYEELANTASKVTGKSITYKAIGLDDKKQALLGAGLDEGTAGFVVALDQSIAEGSLDIDSNDLETLLGRKPANLENSLKSLLA